MDNAAEDVGMLEATTIPVGFVTATDHRDNESNAWASFHPFETLSHPHMDNHLHNLGNIIGQFYAS